MTEWFATVLCVRHYGISLLTFYIKMQIQWKFHIILIQILIDRLQQIFAHSAWDMCKTLQRHRAKNESIVKWIWYVIWIRNAKSLVDWVSGHATDTTKYRQLPGHTQYHGTSGADRSVALIDWLISLLLLLSFVVNASLFPVRELWSVCLYLPNHHFTNQTIVLSTKISFYPTKPSFFIHNKLPFYL